MCIKFPPGDLNFSPYPPHSTNTYTCRVTTASKMHGSHLIKVSLFKFCLLITMQRLESSDWGWLINFCYALFSDQSYKNRAFVSTYPNEKLRYFSNQSCCLSRLKDFLEILEMMMLNFQLGYGTQKSQPKFEKSFSSSLEPKI